MKTKKIGRPRKKLEYSDFERDFINEVQSGKPIDGENGLIGKMVKKLINKALQAEMELYISEEENEDNRRNGYANKTLKSNYGELEIETPRDRKSQFEPSLIPKRARTISEAIEEKILSLYSVGMSYQDIQEHVHKMYGLEYSAGSINQITDKLLPEIQAWQNSPLEEIYPAVWLDCIFYKIREDGQYKQKAIYSLLALNLEGKKQILGLYTAQTEGAKFWANVLGDLKKRGIKQILIACVDGLKGFPEAINATFPETEIQLCIVHQVRNSLKYVCSKDQREFLKDLKQVYQANSKAEAEQKLLEVDQKWSKKYKIALEGWKQNWEKLSNYFKYSREIRRVIYTTNPIESVHRKFRKLTKTKGGFVNENALMKQLYLGIKSLEKKWTQPMANWSLIISELGIYFDLNLTNIPNNAKNLESTSIP